MEAMEAGGDDAGAQEPIEAGDTSTLWPSEPIFLRGWRARPQLISQLINRLAWATPGTSTLFSHPAPPPLFGSHSDSDDDQSESSQSSEDEEEPDVVPAQSATPVTQPYSSPNHAATQTSAAAASRGATTRPPPSCLFSILNRWLEQYSQLSDTSQLEAGTTRHTQGHRQPRQHSANFEAILRRVRGESGSATSFDGHSEPAVALEPGTPLQMSEAAVLMQHPGTQLPQLSPLRVRQLSSGQALHTRDSASTTISYTGSTQHMRVTSPPGRLPSISAVSDGSDTPVAWSSVLGEQGNWVLQHNLPGQVADASGQSGLVSPWQMTTWTAPLDSPSTATAASVQEFARWAQPRQGTTEHGDEEGWAGQGAIIPTHAVLYTQTSLISLESLNEPGDPAWGSTAAHTVDQAIQTTSSSFVPSLEGSSELPATTDQAIQASLSSSSVLSLTLDRPLSAPSPAHGVPLMTMTDADTGSPGFGSSRQLWLPPAAAPPTSTWTDASFDLLPSETTTAVSTQTAPPRQVSCYGYGSLLAGNRTHRVVQHATTRTASPPPPPPPANAPDFTASTNTSWNGGVPRMVSTAASTRDASGQVGGSDSETVVQAGARIPRLSTHQIPAVIDDEDDDSGDEAVGGMSTTTTTTTQGVVASHLPDDVESVIQDVVDSVVRDTAAVEARPTTTSRFAGASNRLAQLLRRGAELAGVGSATGFRGFGRGAGVWSGHVPSRPAWHPAEITRHQARIRQALSTRFWSNDPPGGDPLTDLDIPTWAARFHPQGLPPQPVPAQQPAAQARRAALVESTLAGAEALTSSQAATAPIPVPAPVAHPVVCVDLPADSCSRDSSSGTCAGTGLTTPLASPGGTVVCSVHIHSASFACGPQGSQAVPPQLVGFLCSTGEQPAQQGACSSTTGEATTSAAADQESSAGGSGGGESSRISVLSGATTEGTSTSPAQTVNTVPRYQTASGQLHMADVDSSVVRTTTRAASLPHEPQPLSRTRSLAPPPPPPLPPTTLSTARSLITTSLPNYSGRFEATRARSWLDAGRRASGRGGDQVPQLLAHPSQPDQLVPAATPPATPLQPQTRGERSSSSSSVGACSLADLATTTTTAGVSSSSCDVSEPQGPAAPSTGVSTITAAALLAECDMLPSPPSAMKELSEWLELRGVNVQAAVVSEVLQCLGKLPEE